MAKWIADHRVLTRIVLITIDVGLVALLVAGSLSGGNPWYAYLQLVVWGVVTVNFGWTIPRSVDALGRGQDGDREPS